MPPTCRGYTHYDAARNIWAHHNELTEYLVWVIYWRPMRQPNLYTGRELDNSCKKLQCCRGAKETMEHLLVMPVSAGLLAESHLSSDRKMLGACTTSSHIVHDARHRSCLELLRNVSVEIIPTKNGIRTSLGANMAYHEQYMYYDLMDHAKSSGVPL